MERWVITMAWTYRIGDEVTILAHKYEAGGDPFGLDAKIVTLGEKSGTYKVKVRGRFGHREFLFRESDLERIGRGAYYDSIKEADDVVKGDDNGDDSLRS